MRLAFRHQLLKVWRHTIRLMGLMLLWVAVAQSVYANALVQSFYRPYSGDLNGDGRTDILLKASSSTVMITIDDLFIPVTVSPKIATFVLTSNADATYSLINNPASELETSGVWQPDSHDLVYGDVLGNGLGSVLIKARVSGAPSFVVAMSSSTAPQLIQQITTATLGVDLGAPGTTAELRSFNSDSRTDLVVNTNGRIAAVFIADQNGIFRRDDETSIQAVWAGLMKEFSNGDPNMAAQYLVEQSREQYREAFTDLGADLKKISTSISTIRALSRTDTFAEYVFTQNVGGSNTMHIVPFVRHNGLWSISGF